MRFSPIELAVGAALLGSVAAVAIPAFAREIHASRFVEPATGLARIGEAAVSFAEAHGTFPPSAPLTPNAVPRGQREVDPPGTWDAPTWKALDFQPVAEGAPHAYAFSFDGSQDAFVAQARGDLDGDGILSTFEIRGFNHAGDRPMVVPGMYVASEVE